MYEFNEYWLVKKISNDFHTEKLYDESIVELTRDGLIFIWPKEPDRRALCDVCAVCPQLPDKELAAYKKAHCQPPEDRMQPCPFVPVENIENQDVDDFMADGACLAGGGYYHNLSDYLKDCQLPRDQFLILSLGYERSIRSVRLMLLQHPEIAAL